MRTSLSRIAGTGRAVGAVIAAAPVILVAPAVPAAAAQPPRAPTSTAVSPQSFVVTSRSDSGAGSLRAAIAAADVIRPENSAVISFSVSGIVTLASPLPAVSRRVTIDARSAPGYVKGGPPVVEIDCNGHPGLRFAVGSAGAKLLGVAVDNASGTGVTLNTGSITLNNNYIGLDLTGAAFGNDGDGVYVSPHSSGNLIGLNVSGASGAVANVISGNSGNGIVLAGSSGNTVVANRIGTNAAGKSAIANGGNGIWITAGSSHNEIGGTDFTDSATGKVNNPTGSKGKVPPVFVVLPLGNLISGNVMDGVLIDSNSQQNVLNGNFIGTTAKGDGAIGNGGDGVSVNGAGSNALIGCAAGDNPFVYYNVVSGNGGNGLRVTNSDNVVVQGNFFGIGANNTTVLANRRDGIRVAGTSANTQVGGPIPLGNVSSGNGQNGIAVTGTAHGFVTFSTFGGLLAFKGAAPNRGDGLLITSTGGGNLARANVFSGNMGYGVAIVGGAHGNKVFGSFIGTEVLGVAALGNQQGGVLIGGRASRNSIGSLSPPPANLISGNTGNGVTLQKGTLGNSVINNYIGLNRFRRCLRNTGRALANYGSGNTSSGNRFRCGQARARPRGQARALVPWQVVRARAWS